MPNTSLLPVLKPKWPLTSQRSWRFQPIGMTLLVPSQYIQNDTLVFAPGARLTGSPPILKAPPLPAGPGKLP